MKIELPDRLKALPPYLFVEIDRKKRAARDAGQDVIDFGVGDPDLPTHRFIVERMQRAVENSAHHRYPRDRGAPEFRAAIARFFGQRYGVTLDPETEILALVGSKEGVGHLPLAVVNPGRTVLVPEPGYPVYRSGTIFAGGRVHVLPLTEERGWLPDLAAIPGPVARDAALLYLNYPNNPTGAIAPRTFLEEAVEFCRRHDVVLAYDAAYNEMYYGPPAPSILQVAGAKEVAIELHSLSKTFNMTGWRIGFAVGHPELITALSRIKTNVDSGTFTATQEAGIAAYDGIDRPELHRQREIYRERMTVMSDGLAKLGFRVRKPEATFYIWAGVPRGYDSMRVTMKLLDEAAVVCVPGLGFGASCDGYVRFSMTVDVARVHAALERIRGLRW